MLAYILHAWYEGMRSPDKGGLDCYHFSNAHALTNDLAMQESSCKES